MSETKAPTTPFAGKFPDDRTLRAWANETDATRDGAYAISLAAIEARENMVAIHRAENLSGADYYVAPPGSDPDDLENSFRLEVSGTDLGNMTVVRQRLLQKQEQTRAGRSNIPAIASVVGQSRDCPRGRRMSWIAAHRESEIAASGAEVLVRDGHRDQAMIAYTKAAALEEEALRSLASETDKPRTLGILAVSAAALWFKARELRKAESLILNALVWSHLPAFAVQDLRVILQSIWTEDAKQGAGVSFLPGQVLVSVKGGEVVVGGAPLDLIVDKVKDIQSLFLRTIEHMLGVPFRRRGPPSARVHSACRPWLFQAAPGSYQFSVAVQEPAQHDLFRDDVSPDRVVDQFLQIVEASASGQPGKASRCSH